MRKILSLLMTVLFAGSLFAADAKTSTLTFTKACGGSGVADDEAEWTITSDGTESTYDSNKGIHYGTGSAAVGYIQLSTSDIEGTISQVVVNASTASGVTASVSVKVGTTDFKTTGDATSIAISTTATDYTFTGSASGEIIVKVEKPASANKALYVKSVVVTYVNEGGSTPTTQDLYLTLSSDWAGWTEKYSVYYFDDKTNGWSAFMTAVEGEENMWTTTIPVGYSKIIFVRNNSGAAAPGWDSGDYSIVWSKTVDLTIPEGKNHFTVTSGGTGSECNGTWSTYTPGVAPEPVDSMTVYFYNNLDWATVNTFVWPAEGNAYKTWPGEAAKKEAEQIHGKDVYAYTFPASYVNVIFNNGTKQTTDQVWVEAKPYFVPGTANGEGKFDGTWCAKEDIPAPEAPAKFYITGDTALVVAAGVDKMKAWQPNAIKSEADTLELNLAAGDYVLKLTLDGTWAEGKARGYSNLTAPAAEGLSADKDDNICFKLTEAGIVKVIYFVAEEKETFKLEGDFYVKPIVKKELKLVPGEVWNVDGAQFAAYLWGDNDYQAEWTPFFAGEGDTLSVEINAEADSMVLVRFSDKVAAPTWENEETNIWGKIDKIEIDYTSLVYTVTSYTTGTWEVYEPEVPAKFYITGDTALVVDGGADKMMAWKPNAIKSETDTFTLNLKADVDYILKVTLNGTWEGENNVKGFNELSEKTPGLLDISNDHNIGFRLNEAGEVKVVYKPAANEEPEVFKLIGDFYVKPIVKKELKLVPGAAWDFDGAQFAAYLWGDNDYQAEWTPFFAGEGDTLSVEINAEADSMVLVRFSDQVAAPTWENEETNIWGKIDKIEIDYTSLVYTVTSYTTGTWEVYEPVIIDLEDGFYLVGTFNGVDAWSLEDLSAEKLFKVTDQEGQYSIDVTLLAGDEFKAIEVKDNALIEWYPKEGGNYVVDDAHAGKKTIYFRPEFWADWNGHFYVAPNPGESINNVEAVKAVKVLRDGQIMIIKGNKTYNVLGAEIR